jgi:hypothetical protein
MDQGYLDVNAPEIYSADLAAFTNYIASREYHKLLESLQ